MSEVFSQYFRFDYQTTALAAAAGLAIGAGAIWAFVYYVFYAVRSQISGATIWCGSGENNSVALTFDDGPAPETLEILDLLRTENVKATFFLIGQNVEKYPEIARRIARENHEIGNHSYSHPIYLFCSARRTHGELERTQAIIKEATGVEPKFARPPCGVRSLAYFAAAKNLGLQTVQWSDTGYDWKKISAESIAENVLQFAQSGSIILLHDGDSAGKNARRATVEALPLILRKLREKKLCAAPLRDICRTLNEKSNEENRICSL